MHHFVPLLTVLLFLSVSADDVKSTIQTVVKDSTDIGSLFSLERTGDMLDSYYEHSDNPQHVLVYVNDTVDRFSVRLQSVNTDIVTLSGETVVSRCHSNRSKSSPSIASSNASVKYNYTVLVSETRTCYNISFNTLSPYLGYSPLKIYVAYNTSQGEDDTSEVLIGSVVIRSLRLRRTIDKVFNVLVIFLVAVATMGMGCDLDVETIKKHLKKPLAPIIGLVSQFTFMPLLSYAVIYIMGYEGGWALGLFAMGCSPGGGQSNIFSKLFNGDVTLSVTMTTLSTILSVAMMPLWLYTLGRTLPAEEEVGRIQIPFLSILQSLVTLIIPLLIGALIRYKLPRVAKFFRRGLKVFFLVVIILFLTVGVYSNLFIYRSFNVKLVFTAALMPYGGYVFSGLVALAFRLEWKIVKTIIFETGLQNLGVCMLVIYSALDAPERDLACIAPLAAMLMSSFPILLVCPFYLLWDRHRKKNMEKDAEKSRGIKKGREEDNKLNDSRSLMTEGSSTELSEMNRQISTEGDDITEDKNLLA